MNYERLQDLVSNFDLPIMGENEEGEMVLISKGKDNEFILETAQDNGWMRINTYYPDGAITEIFEK